MAWICSPPTSNPDEPGMGFRAARLSVGWLAPSELLDSGANYRGNRELYGYCNRPLGADDLLFQLFQICNFGRARYACGRKFTGLRYPVADFARNSERSRFDHLGFVSVLGARHSNSADTRSARFASPVS